MENELANAGRDSRTCLARPNSQARTGSGKSCIQLTTSRIGNLTPVDSYSAIICACTPVDFGRLVYLEPTKILVLAFSGGIIKYYWLVCAIFIWIVLCTTANQTTFRSYTIGGLSCNVLDAKSECDSNRCSLV